MSRRLFLAGAAAAGLLRSVAARAADAATRLLPRQIPARLLPVPRTVSPALQAAIAAPYPPGWDSIPPDAAAWRAMAAQSAAAVAPLLPDLRRQLRIAVTPRRIAGVPVFDIVPEDLPAENRDRVLLHLHGGAYVLYPGEAGAGEGMLLAGRGFRVISVDYRMPPDFPFPAALDDALAVWRALLAEHDPRRMAVFGSSAGGGLTLALMLRARAEGLALPAAIAPGTPWADLAAAGDSVMANAYVDNVLVSNAGWLGAAATLYAAGRALTDPLVSPLYGDFAGLPPAIVTSGTRDLLLSDSVRTHRKLRQAGIAAELQVFEGLSHAQFLDPALPESAEALGEIARFFRAHLA
ncbi:MAG: alpha/beta hydrolase [Dongiaceae bacterium]